MTEVTIDPIRQEQARHYERLRRRLMVVDLGFGTLYLLLWLLTGWSVALRQSFLMVTQNDWLIVAGYAVVFGGIYTLLDLPLSHYSGFVLPHRFGMSTQTLKSWITDQVKELLVGGVLGLILVEVVYLVLRLEPQNWWLWVSGVILLFNVLLANLAPILIYPLFYKFKPLSEEYAGLAERLKHLAEQANTRVRGVYQFDMSSRTKAANAALTGLGSTRRIILGDTLLKEFTPDEIETVLAHELGHHVHNDIPIGMVLQTMLTLAGLYLASTGLQRGLDWFGFTGPADMAALPLIALVLEVFGLVLLPLQNTFSRWVERRADEYALNTTRKGEAYASALTRLANQNLADADPEPWVEFILYSHPALSRRIAAARKIK